MEYDAAQGTLLLHVFDLVDEAGWTDLIKHRYERAAAGDLRMSATILIACRHASPRSRWSSPWVSRRSAWSAGRARRTGCWRSTRSMLTRCCCCVTLGMRTGSAFFFEAALVIAMLGFVATVALAKFLMRGEVIE